MAHPQTPQTPQTPPGYVTPAELTAGMLVYLAPTSSTPSRVVEIGEATHALAGAYGALALTVETFLMGDPRSGILGGDGREGGAGPRWGTPRRVTAWPGDTYRVETEPDVWLI